MARSPETGTTFTLGLTMGYIRFNISCKLSCKYFLFDTASRRPDKSYVGSHRGGRGTLEEEG